MTRTDRGGSGRLAIVVSIVSAWFLMADIPNAQAIRQYKDLVFANVDGKSIGLDLPPRQSSVAAVAGVGARGRLEHRDESERTTCVCGKRIRRSQRRFPAVH